MLTLRSNQRGRSHRGRIYLPCPRVLDVDTNGRLQAPTPANTVAQLTGLQTALGGAALTPFWEIGIASYLHSYFTPLLAATMDSDIDVQRRRKK